MHLFVGLLALLGCEVRKPTSLYNRFKAQFLFPFCTTLGVLFRKQRECSLLGNWAHS